jgi:hypothetical protein
MLRRDTFEGSRRIKRRQPYDEAASHSRAELAAGTGRHGWRSLPCGDEPDGAITPVPAMEGSGNERAGIGCAQSGMHDGEQIQS